MTQPLIFSILAGLALALAGCSGGVDAVRLSYDEYLDWCQDEGFVVYGYNISAADAYATLEEQLGANRRVTAPDTLRDYHAYRDGMFTYLLRIVARMDDDDQFTAVNIERYDDGRGAGDLFVLMARILISNEYYDLVDAGCIEDVVPDPAS